jgi:phi13 family phage major tail protein
MANKKVQFGLKNVHYAVITGVDEQNNEIYSTPKRLPYAVNITLTPNGDKSEVFADDMIIFTEENNLGYTGTLELTTLQNDFMTEVMDMKTVAGVELEYTTSQPKEFALIFEFSLNEGFKRTVFYRCTVGRTPVSAATNQQQKTFQNAVLNLFVNPTYNYCVKGAVEKNDENLEVFNDFFNKVYTKKELESIEATRSINAKVLEPQPQPQPQPIEKNKEVTEDVFKDLEL